MDNLENISKCSNCGKEIPKGASYCPYCGQTTKVKKIKLFDLIRDFFSNFIVFDLKIFKTLFALLVPGKITRDFFSGKHGRYTSPWRLFLTSIIIMLILVNINSRTSIIKVKDTGDKNFQLYSLNEFNTGLSQRKPETKEYTDSIKATINKNNAKPKFHSVKNIFSQDSVLSNIQIDSLDNDRKKDKSKNRFDLSKIKNRISPNDFENIQHTLCYLDSTYIQGDTIIKKVADSSRAVLKNQLTDIYLDSISLMDEDIRISKYDINTLPLDQIKAKYNIAEKGFFTNTIRTIFYKINSKKITFNKIRDYLLKNINWYIIFLLPFTALVFKLLYIRRKRYFVEHLVFNLYNHSAIMFMFVIFTIAEWTHNEYIQNIFGMFIAFAPMFYYIFAIKKYYRQGWFKTIAKSFIFLFIYFNLIIILTLVYAGIAAVMI